MALIGRRLNRLSEQCNRALTTAAIIGRQFDFKLLHAFDTGTPEEQLAGAMDEALAPRLIDESTGLAEGYQFSHSLVQETLASELSATRKVRLGARIGEAPENLYRNEAETHAADLALHWREGHRLLNMSANWLHPGPEELGALSS